MQLEIQFKLKQNPYYISYLRSHSYWYKKLNRDPMKIKDFTNEIKIYNRELKSNKISQTLEYLEMLSTVMSSFK